MPKISPFLWFDTQAEEAATFYTSLFADSRILATSRYPEGSHQPAGSVMTVDFELAGQRFTALNGGPLFPFTEAISLSIDCEDAAEVDRLWAALGEGAVRGECGWIKDRYGLSWQVVPRGLSDLLSDPDPGRAQRAVQAMLGMRKLDLAAMRAAADAG